MRVFLSFVFVYAVAAFLPHHASVRKSVAVKMGYVPDGMTPEQYRKLRNKEQEAAKTKKFGAFGPQSFVSRSLQSFQTDMEKGKTSHLMPVMNAKQLVQAGKIKPEEVPYMQRGGAWDNSDIAGAKKLAWNEKDKTYNASEKPWWGSGAPKTGGPISPTSVASPKKSPQAKKFGLF